MRLRLFNIILASLFMGSPALAQYDQEKEDLLTDLFTGIQDTTDVAVKINYNNKIISIIDKYVKSDSIFKIRLDVRNLGQVVSPDSSIKLVTWNLNTGIGSGKYYSYFIRKGKISNNIYSLVRDYDQSPLRTDTIYDQDKWYGALYYDIRPYEDRISKYYVLLGLDYGNPDVARKIIDVLRFRDDGEMLFGRKFFQNLDRSMSYREVFEYSSEARMTMRFTSDTSIVFDHLVPLMPEMSSNRKYYGPDYSYDAFILTGDLWKFFLNIDVRNSEY